MHLMKNRGLKKSRQRIATKIRKFYSGYRYKEKSDETCPFKRYIAFATNIQKGKVLKNVSGIQHEYTS